MFLVLVVCVSRCRGLGHDVCRWPPFSWRFLFCFIGGTKSSNVFGAQVVCHGHLFVVQFSRGSKMIGLGMPLAKFWFACVSGVLFFLWFVAKLLMAGPNHFFKNSKKVVCLAC